MVHMLDLAFAAILAFNPASAETLNANPVSADLVAEAGSVRPGQPVMVGVRFRMEPGWHIYWQNPGDSGKAPAIAWKLPPGFKAGEIIWPRPERMEEGPLVSYGYSGTVLLQVRLTPPADIRPASGISLGASVTWLACKEMCIPGKAELALDLPVGSGAAGPNAGVFARARDRLPAPMPGGWRVMAETRGDKLVLTISGTGVAIRKPAFFFPLEPDILENTAPQSLDRNAAGWTLSLNKSPLLAGPPKSLKGVLAEGERAWMISVPVGTTVPGGPNAHSPAAGNEAGIGFLWAVVLAFLGGIILNLMPCVFPVLSIKVLGFVRESTHNPREVKVHGLLYGLGVVASFWVLAILLVMLRAGGQQLGWGFQLQSPAVILLLTVTLFLLSLNLLGLYEAGSSIVRTAGKFTWTEGRTGAFLTGVLATFLATPCTAPFMGTAVGFAAIQPAQVGFGVFTALGMGMAMPYIALSFAPHIGRILPKPGRWMETFKQAMAFPLLATVIWLLWVLGLQAGLMAVVSALGALLVTGLAGWLYGRWHNGIMRLLAVALVVGGMLAAVRQAKSGTSIPSADEDEWQAYSKARMEQFLSTGRPVFLDFTAAWCLTCKANEMVALNNGSVRKEFLRRRVIMVRADWTNQNPEIERALAEYGRNGVPLYLLFPGGKDNPPRILPQLLTPKTLIAELERLPVPER